MTDYWITKMRLGLKTLVVAIVACSCISDTWAQAAPSRFELGHRLRRLERALNDRQEIGDRKLVLADMEQAVRGYFAMNPEGVARSLDLAYGKVLAAGLTPALDPGAFSGPAAWVLRGKRFHVGSRPEEFDVELSAMYAVDAPAQGAAQAPIGGVLRLQSHDGQVVATAEVTLKPGKLRLGLPVDLAQGDYVLSLDCKVSGVPLEVARMQISWVPELNQRIAVLESKLADKDSWGPNVWATVDFAVGLLRRAFSRQNSEMDLPALRVLRQSEQLAEDPVDWSAIASLGPDVWLGLRGESKRGRPARSYLRVFQPKRKSGQLRPCVVALHGAGGSENLFFDGYGDGMIRELCEQRGWVLIAPRCGFGGVGMPFQQVLDALQEPLGIDPGRVFLVGHSMGVGAVASALREPRGTSGPGYRGVAAIGGGMANSVRGDHIGTPFLVVTGSNDFAAGGAKAMHKSLLKQGYASRLDVLDGVEHMGVVQFSLPDVFQFFDSCLGS
ncbi:MAG: hypothetical protein P1V35_14175 [Planctomycetota bacterium]|nr:hypothetical protein [Planctomycetota bacterium]